MYQFTNSHFEAMMRSNGRKDSPRYVLQIWNIVTLIDYDRSDDYETVLRELNKEKSKGNYAQIHDTDWDCLIV